MTEVLHEFTDGPYDVLEYSVRIVDGNAIIDVNNGDLGRLRIESLKSVEEMREALDKVESELKEVRRRQEEL